MLLLILFEMFIYFGERELKQGMGGARGDRGAEVGSVLTTESPMWGLNL